MPDMSSRRRALVQAFIALGLVLGSRISRAQKKSDEPPGADGEAGKAADAENAAKGTPKKATTAVLTVVVTGGDKPVAQAEVKVKFPPAVGGEAMRPTNQDGEATFSSAGIGTAKVRVIAKGWESALQEIKLKDGAQRMAIKLKSQTDGK